MPKQGGQGKGKPKKVDRNFGISLIKSQANRSTNINNKSGIFSIVDNSSLDDYILSAEMSESKVEVIKQVNDIHLIEQNSNYDRPIQVAYNGQYCYNQLAIPRRPHWDKCMTANELHRLELESFMKWRRNLAELEMSNQTFKLTPFEKNIDVWRQLWRVIEKSNLLIQIVDARNPLFYFSDDLRLYISDLNLYKHSIMLVNKADFLTSNQRKAWSEKFIELKIPFIFYSAKLEEIEINKMNIGNNISTEISNSLAANQELENDESSRMKRIDAIVESIISTTLDSEEVLVTNNIADYSIINRIELVIIIERVLNAMSLQQQSSNSCDHRSGRTFGFIGYPNVGKSSVINNLLNVSKTYHGPRSSISSTPGKTKHLQTFVLKNGLTLCDCPGLVFPSFMKQVGEMLISGILPINNMRDCIDPANCISIRIPKHILEGIYGLTIVRDLDVFDDPHRPPTAHEMLSAYCKVKGYITNGTGRWDEFRATKELLRDFNDGRILYVTPPDSSDVDIDNWLVETEKTTMQNEKVLERINKKMLKVNESDELDVISEQHCDNDKIREHKRLPRWGKKNRKLRDKTPYDEASGHGTDSYVSLFKNRNPVH